MRGWLFGSLACFLFSCSGSDSASSDAAVGGSTAGGSTSGSGANGSSAGTNGGGDASGGGSNGTSAGDGSASVEAGTNGKDGAVSADASTSVTCDPREIVCKAAETPCPEGEVHQVIENCYGPCVPITTCPCDAPEACPHSEQFTCWNNTGHCNYYGP